MKSHIGSFYLVTHLKHIKEGMKADPLQCYTILVLVVMGQKQKMKQNPPGSSISNLHRGVQGGYGSPSNN